MDFLSLLSFPFYFGQLCIPTTINAHSLQDLGIKPTWFPFIINTLYIFSYIGGSAISNILFLWACSVFGSKLLFKSFSRNRRGLFQHKWVARLLIFCCLFEGSQFTIMSISPTLVYLGSKKPLPTLSML